MKKFITYIFPLTVLLAVAVNVFFDEPSFTNLKDKLKHYKVLNDKQGQLDTYYELVQQDSLNIDYHFNFIQSHFALRKKNEVTDLYGFSSRDSKIITYYDRISQSANNEYAEIGKFGKGLCYYNLELFDLSFNHFILLENQNQKYLNYLYSTWNHDAREEYYLKEVRCHPDNYLAFQGLADLYISKGRPNEIVSLLKDEAVYSFLSVKQKRYAYFNTGQIFNYAQAIFSRFFQGLNLPGFLGAAFILVVWFIYLLKIHKFLIKKIKLALIVVVLGMLFAFVTSLLTDFNAYVIGFHRTYEFFHDFVYCVVGIGMIEELVKIVPLILVITFSKKLKEPIDYLVFASISALGFAFIENLIYFEDSGLRTMQGRALTATVTHMFDSSLVAYGIVIGKFAKKKNWGWYFFVFYLIASLVHGFYDFWLINDLAQTFSFITFIWLLISMVIWVSLINNCLNNSYSKAIIWTYNPDQLNSFLLYGLSAVFMLEYLIMGYKFGAANANIELQKDLSSGLFLLIFLTINLSKFDYIPNYWAPLRFWDWDVFLSIPKVDPQFYNFKEIVGVKVHLKSFSKAGTLGRYLPVEGEVVKRELLSWEKDWFLIKLHSPIQVGWKTQLFLLVKCKNESELFLQKQDQIVQVRLVNNLDDLSKMRKKKTDFALSDFARISKI